MRRPSNSIFLLCLLGIAVATAGVAVADTTQAETAIIDTPTTLIDSGDESANTTDTTTQEADRPNIIVTSANTSNYLSPPSENVTREQYATAGLDVGGAVQSDSLRLQGAHAEREFQERLENGDSDIAEETLEQLESDVQTIESQYQSLFRQYSEGEIGDSTLLREVARLGVLGQQYSDLTQTALETGTLSDDIDLRYRNLLSEVALYSSPIVEHIDSEFRDDNRTTMYVQGGRDSLVVGTVLGDSYLRQAILFGERDRTEPERFGNSPRSAVEEAFERARTFYPWALSEGVQSEVQGFGDSSVYRVQASHSHGELRSYLDGATRNPFFEIQEKNPFAVPASDFSQETGNGLRLSVESTAPTGPMRIDIVETQGQTRNLTVSINGNPVETIRGSQTIWIVQPRGNFDVTVETASGEEVSASVFP
jgi:hypothetical protein